MKCTRASWSSISNLLVMLTWKPLFVVKLVNPHYAYPGRTMALHWCQPILPDNNIDDLAVCHIRIHGAVGMSPQMSARCSKF
jgi:hypothetical protein